MKIFVYGNCQAASYGAALCNLVEAEAVYVAGRDSYDRLDECDAVFLQSEFAHHATTPGSALKLTGQRVIPLPTFLFLGLAPDAIIEENGGQRLLCPAGVYNSSIALHGFVSGYSVEETIALFNAKTYRTLQFDDYWAPSRDALVADLDACGLDGKALFESFTAHGKFAYSPHHPVLAVFEAIVRNLMRVHDLPAASRTLQRPDPMMVNGDWPLYPGFAPAVDAPRSYDFCFDPPQAGRWIKSAIPLADFVRRSFDGYAALPEGSIRSERLAGQADLYARVVPPVGAVARAGRHVYADLPDSAYWKRAVATPAPEALDPVVAVKWPIGPRDRIATAGSCFAQHIARTLVEAGRSFLDSEPAPASLDPEEAARRHYGVFSARYGNVYTARQLVQLVTRATGAFVPADRAWRRPDGRYIDPFRPQIEPDGFASPADTAAATAAHLHAVLAMLETMDVFVFTLGLTETWECAADGSVFPIPPGVMAGTMDRARYRFVNFRAGEVRADLRRALALMRDINPKLRVILTVSPVPLVATYEARHVLVSTTYSKSALRVAADEIAQDHDWVDYFPSYEIITGSYNGGRYFAADKRSVTPEGVQRVMACFSRHYLDGAVVRDARSAAPDLPAPDPAPAHPPATQVGGSIAAEIAARSRFLCDEEALTPPGAAEEPRRHYASA